MTASNASEQREQGNRSGAGAGVSAALARAADACERFAQSKLRCFALAFVYVTVVFGIAMFAWVPHGVNDDWSIANALSGNWGDPQGLCLFLNALLCQAIFALNQTFPQFIWFSVLELATSYVSFLVIAYMALSRSKPPLACLLIAGITWFIVPGCTIQANFTYVSFLACCAGGLLLLCSLQEGRHRAHLVCAGVAFLALGILWRGNMFLVCIPVFGVAALLVAFAPERRKAVGVGKCALRLWPFAVAIAVFAALLAYDGAAWSQQPWQGWLDYNNARSEFSDYPRKDFDDIKGELAEIGVSENDYDMMLNWMTEDPEFFTTERVKAIVDVATVDIFEPMRVVKNCARFFYRLLTNTRLAVLLGLLVLTIAVTLRGRARLAAFAILAATALTGMALLVLGRLPARVSYPLWMFAFASVCALVPAAYKPWEDVSRRRARAGKAGDGDGRLNDEDGQPGEGDCQPSDEDCATSDDAHQSSEAAHGIAHDSGKSLSPPIRGVANSAISLAVLIMPIVTATLMLSSAVTHLHPERVQALFAADTFEVKSSLIDYMADHPDNVFLMNAGSNYDLVYAGLMAVPNSAQVNAQTVSLGGWGARAPYAQARNVRVNMANPVKGLVENENAIYVTASESASEMMTAYLAEHYYPNVSCKKIGTVKSWSGNDKLHLYKFSAE